MKNLIKTVIKTLGLYPAYSAFAQARASARLQKDFWNWTSEDQQRLDFYSQFLGANDVVFDVGANMGNRCKVFRKLGAKVIAIEPQSSCARFLESVFRDDQGVTLVKKALGPNQGKAEMLISNVNTLSTLSQDWVEKVQASGRFANYKWNRKETVELETLDNLIKQFGSPAFLKIDVEGFEDKVLAGLASPVKAVSVEFTPENLAGITKCIDSLCQLGKYQFQFSEGESMQFVLDDWVNDEQMRKFLNQAQSGSFGDVYARCVTS
jgi:FkbM family methyltransferase